MFQLGKEIRVQNEKLVRGRVRHVLFDFDGTLSLIREGWQAVMIPMMVEVLSALGTGETHDELFAIVSDYVARLTGKQTIYQMIELAEQIRKRGGEPRTPLEYKHEYLRRLEDRIASRIDALAGGRTNPDQLLLPGARALLDHLRDRDVTMYLASGTDEPFVLREARLLGIDHYFDGRIYGALDDYAKFSKQLVIERILSAHRLHGPEFLAIGDGYVEIENTKSVGGITVGVASLESNPGGWDRWKEERLSAAGADVLVPHFLEYRLLLDYLFGA
jgi:phosphoglycolate phosphatase-like HAD superfamily hydrolase